MSRQADWTLTRKLLMSIKPVAASQASPIQLLGSTSYYWAVPHLVAAAEAVD